MKKLLLIAAASTALLSSASFAECDMNAPMDSTSSMENQWYAKINAGGIIFDKTKPANSKVGKLKSNTGFIGDIGAGYYIMDNLRTDLTVGMVASNHLKKSKTYNDANGISTYASLKHKPTIISVLLNGYVDFIDLSMFKVFAGGGAGIAFVKEKVNSKITTATSSNTFNSTTKNKTNFTYQLSLGTSFEVAEGVKAELVYSWTDYGKTKTKNVTVDKVTTKIGGTRYRGNNLMAGLRFDM